MHVELSGCIGAMVGRSIAKHKERCMQDGLGMGAVEGRTVQLKIPDEAE